MTLPLEDSAAPLYVRLKEALSRLIDVELSVGDQLPSESKLVSEYGVSRMTVRLALGALANEGLIVRKQGRGTFVAEPKRDVTRSGHRLTRPVGIGDAVAITTVSFDTMAPTPIVARYLGIGLTDLTHKVRHLHFLDHAPVCYRVTYLPAALLPEMTESVADEAAMWAALRESGADQESADEWAEALCADQFRADLLETTPGAPLLLIQRVCYDHADRPIALERSFYCGNAMRLQLAAHAASQTPGLHIALRDSTQPDHELYKM